MAKWLAQVAIVNPAWNGPVDGPAAIAAVTSQLNTALAPTGFTVVNVTGQPVYSLGEWVIATRVVGGNTVPDYGRIVQHSNGVDLQVEFADTTRRPVSAIVSRVA